MAEAISSWIDATTKIGDALIDWAKPAGRGDSPLKSYPLADFSSAFAIACGYLLFVILGQVIMPLWGKPVKGLMPFKFTYNVVQVMLCSYMCIEACVQAYKAGYTLMPCNPFNQTNPPIGDILYIFYLSKILDFLDTVFIIAEMRWKQLSFLHVYHHFSIFLFYWLNINVGYDGDVYLTIALNGFIHTIMYTYYFVSLHTKEIGWKSALTMSQMIQFVLMNAQAGYLIFTGCQEYPRNITMAYFYYIVSLLLLFAQFFVSSYILGGGKSQRKDKAKQK